MDHKSWPFQEASKIISKLNGNIPKKGFVLFETGYGPSGLPHIGTFGEVARTLMVKNALTQMTDIPSKLFAFSDDMDGLRKIPDNIPNKDMVREHLGKPLSSIPDPFEQYSSFAEYMNNKLKSFLDSFGFEYTFRSATECYRSGEFDSSLIKALEKFDQILKIMLPTLGEERQETYSPFLPICPDTGRVLQIPAKSVNLDDSSITFLKDNGEELTAKVTGGACKMQWKADWALRWAHFDVDYEMHGKDLQPTAELSEQICKILGGSKPILYRYELFLDEEGRKISKSKGNGISVDDWLRYASPESLALFMYQNPGKAKKLYFDVIPKNVDEYFQHLNSYHKTDDKILKEDNPVWHIHLGKVPAKPDFCLSFSLLLNLAAACNAEDTKTMWGFIKKHDPSLNESHQALNNLVQYAVNYFNDFIKPNKHYKMADQFYLQVLEELKISLSAIAPDSSDEEIQTMFFNVAKKLDIADFRFFFAELYQILLGLESGPRMGSFVKILGINETIDIINKAIARNSSESSNL